MGSLTPSDGKLTYQVGGNTLAVEDIYQHISMAAPYVELIEEFTLNELIAFHYQFKSYLPGMDETAIKEWLGFEKHILDKEIRYFSSGMKQRVKLVLACCSSSSLLFLDEPTSNLDKAGEQWYLQLLEVCSKDRLVIIGSNQEHEYAICNEYLEIMDYK